MASRLTLWKDCLWQDIHLVGGLGSRSAEGGLLNFGPAYLPSSFVPGIFTGEDASLALLDVLLLGLPSSTKVLRLFSPSTTGDCLFEGLFLGELTKYRLLPIFTSSEWSTEKYELSFPDSLALQLDNLSLTLKLLELLLLANTTAIINCPQKGTKSLLIL